VKVLFTADIHNDRELIEKVAKESRKADLVVIAGDVLDYGGVLTNKIFSKIEKPIIFVPGNHDSPEFVEFVESYYNNVYVLHLDKLDFDNVTFAGVGFAESIGPWMEMSSNIGKFLKKLENQNLYYTVLVTHEQPESLTADLGISGSKTIDSFLKKKKVKLAVHGHIHEMGCMEFKVGKNKVINVARSIKILDL